MNRFAVAFSVLTLFAAANAGGATQRKPDNDARADDCTTSGSANAKELSLDYTDEETQHALEHALLIGFAGDAFSDEKLRSLKSPCLRASALLDGETLELRGENTDRPMRWARTERADAQIIFLTKVPRPDAASKKLEKELLIGTDLLGRFADDELMYVVGLTGGPGERLITHFFDKLPDDAKLQSVINEIVTNKVSVKLAFRSESKVFHPQKPKN